MSTWQKSTYIDERKLFTVPGALLISVVLLAGTIGVGWAKLQAQVNEIPSIKAQVDAHTQAIAKIDVMANDITWIKQAIARQNRNTSSNETNNR